MWNFETSLQWTGDETGRAGSAGKPDVPVAAPPEFGGPPGVWTPEDLLISAIETCLLMTTLSVVKRQKIPVKSYGSRATGRMEKTPEGLRFTQLEVAVELAVAEAADIEKARRAVAMAEKYCPISNAVKFPVHLQVSVTA